MEKKQKLGVGLGLVFLGIFSFVGLYAFFNYLQKKALEEEMLKHASPSKPDTPRLTDDYLDNYYAPKSFRVGRLTEPRDKRFRVAGQELRDEREKMILRAIRSAERGYNPVSNKRFRVLRTHPAQGEGTVRGGGRLRTSGNVYSNRL